MNTPDRQAKKRYRVMQPFTPAAEEAARIPQGILLLVDGDTGRQQPVFIAKWVVQHASPTVTLELHLTLVEEDTDGVPEGLRYNAAGQQLGQEPAPALDPRVEWRPRRG